VSKLIEFLEKMGQDATLRHATPAQLADALARSGLEVSACAAILMKDQRLLEALLDANANICCMVARPMKEDDEEEEVEEEGDEGGKTEKPKSVKSHARTRRAA
jgi:hypothetical protein